MTPTQPCGPTEACRNKGGAAYAGQGDGANQVEQAAETAGNGGEGERGCNRPDALCGYSHPFSSGGGAGRCVGVWGLRSLWSGAGWGGGLRRVFYKKDFPKIDHFEDSTNKENHYLRNRIRNLYLPQLEKENVQVKKAILEFGKEVSDYQIALAELSQAVDVEDLTQFLSFSEATQRALLQQYLSRFADLNVTREQFQEIHHILKTKSQYRHSIKNGYELIKEYQHFQIGKIRPKSDEKSSECVLNYQNQVYYEGFLFSFGIPLKGENVQQINVSRETSLILRHRQPGDYLIINGHRKKVRRLFIDLKIPTEKRKNAIIVEQFGQIYSILGIELSDLSIKMKNDIMDTVLYIEKIDR